ncbi:MAG: phosphohydrolase, partial [Flavobacteriaceae bacterium]|nr:phosphohydrolase [Flavobacteriaceae bacterium]
MNKDKVIQNTIAFVKDTLTGAEGGHDWFHTQRVLNNAQLIASG